MIPIERRISHSGGFTTAIRIIISVGAKNGTIDNTIELPLVGLALNLVRVPLAIALAVITFYFACRWFRVAEVDEAVGAIGGRLLRLLRRK